MVLYYGGAVNCVSHTTNGWGSHFALANSNCARQYRYHSSGYYFGGSWRHSNFEYVGG